ncbi:MAG: hypothetical protein CMH65_13655 [Nevskiales bacterium]|nr:hypothetical protein [Nevskiales bacterium]
MSGSPSDSPTAGDATGLPECIAGYRILRLLGEGSMGCVYLAEQPQPHRLVALKVLRGAVATEAFRKRFLREIELMAALAHPGIARVYDAGEADTDSGRLPYLVMEYIEGQPLLDFVRAQGLDVPQQLTLLASLCRSVHAAHTQGVIHRDLKPANVLVDPEGTPRVLDFGVARMLDQRGATEMTNAGQVIGTIAYMPWEQLVDTTQVDARSDVYALGVMAYEMLSGHHPYPGLASMTLVGAVRRLGEQAPRPLSQAAPHTRGDVATVVMKALSREPARRYGSAAEFAADLERVLRRQPVEARPPTAGYLLGLLIRRHKGLAAASGLALGSLLLGAGLATWFAVGEARARADAEARGAEAVAANAFLQQMFAAATPAVARGRQLSAQDVLDFADRSLDARADRYPPRVRAELKRGLGMSYNALGELDAAQRLLDEAYTLTVDAFEPGSVARYRTENDRARVLLNAGRYREAEAFLRPLLDGPAADADAVWRLRLVARLGHAVCEQQRFADCEALLEPALAEARAVLGPGDDTTLDMMEWLCFALAPQQRYDEIFRMANQMLPVLEQRYGRDHPRTFPARQWLAIADQELDRLDAAEQRMRSLLDDRLRVQGTANIDIAQTQHRYGMLLLRRAKWTEAEPVLRSAWATFERVRGRDDVGTLVSMVDLSIALRSQGDEQAAFELLSQVVERMDAMDRAITSPDVSFYGYYAAALDDRGQHARALALFERMEPQARALKYRSSPSLGIFIGNMGRCLMRAGQSGRAAEYLREAHALLADALGAEHAETLRVQADLDNLAGPV